MERGASSYGLKLSEAAFLAGCNVLRACALGEMAKVKEMKREVVNKVLKCWLKIAPGGLNNLPSGKQLDDGVALAGCGVHRDSTLHMTLRLRGGPKKAKGKGKGKGKGKKKGSKVRSWAAVDVAAAAYRAV